MSRQKLIKILLVEAVIALWAVGILLVVMWYKPLGPSLDLPAKPAVAAQDNGAAGGDTASGSSGAVAPTPTPESLISQITNILAPPAAAKTGLCDGPAVMTILLVGSDERGDDYLYGLADSIHIVRVDFATPGVMMVDIPRDFWVEIPDISDHYGITHAKLNQAYFFGNPGMGYYDGPGEGPGLLARTLDLNFGIQVDHYLAMDMTTFVNLVDTMDGIDVHFSSKVDLNENQDGDNPALVFEPGDYHFDGSQALALARNRVPTIFQRARYQSMVLKAIEAKLLTPEMVPLWPQLIEQFTHAVQTDLSPSDISKLVCLGQYINRDNTRMVAFPDSMFSNGHMYDPYRQVNTYVLEADYNQIRQYMQEFAKGNWPEQ